MLVDVSGTLEAQLEAVKVICVHTFTQQYNCYAFLTGKER